MKSFVAVIVIGASCLAASISVDGYLKLGSRVGTRTVTLRWDEFPVRYFVTNPGISEVSAQQLQATAARAFDSWNAVEGAETSTQFAGFTASPPRNGDGVSVLGFLNRPELDRVLAATTFLVDTTDGAVLESDIFFNSAFPWSVANAGESGRFDLE